MRFVPFDCLPALEACICQLLDAGDDITRRDALALALGLSGLRVGEVCAARRSQLCGVSNTLHVPQFKRSNPRDAPLHRSVVEALLAWRRDADFVRDCPWLLCTRRRGPVHRTHLERFARRITEKAIGEPMRFHCLRHTFAMRLYRDTRDLFLVKRLLGHRSISSTQVYADSLQSAPESSLIALPGSTQQSRPPLRLFVGDAG